MTKLTTLKDGLVDQLKDLYSAENQLLKAIPKMEKKAANTQLKEAFNAHLQETETQVERLNQISRIIEAKLSGKTCKAMQGLIEEGKEVLQEESENEALIDALLIGAAQRVEHYEIAAYGTACAMAEQLGETKIIALLSESLDEEAGADKKLSTILESEVLSEAALGDRTEVAMELSKKSETHSGKGGKKSGSEARLLAIGACILSLPLLTPFASAETKTHSELNSKQANYQADNTGKNVRDLNSAHLTPQDQRMNANETEVLAHLRREIVANDNLSTNGKNVKIIVQNGVVTLRGPVKSAEERSWIEKASTLVASGYRVDNQLEVSSR